MIKKCEDIAVPFSITQKDKDYAFSYYTLAIIFLKI